MKSSKHAETRPRGHMPVADWFTLPQAEKMVKARQAWGLLRWYHHTWVIPNRGIRGVLRRMWWRISGQRGRLLSPWEQLDLKIRAMVLEAEAAALEGAEELPTAIQDDEPPPAIEVVKR